MMVIFLTVYSLPVHVHVVLLVFKGAALHANFLVLLYTSVKRYAHQGESSYADVACVPVISISAPKQEVTYSEVRNTEAVSSHTSNL